MVFFFKWWTVSYACVVVKNIGRLCFTVIVSRNQIYDPFVSKDIPDATRTPWGSVKIGGARWRYGVALYPAEV